MRLTFKQAEGQRAHVYRRVSTEGHSWEHIGEDVRSPFTDPAAYPPGTRLEYHVQFLSESHAYEGHSTLARITLV